MSQVFSDSMTELSIATFKDVCETLGRFADIRETAKEPRDRIVAQVGGGRLKFIAGDEQKTVVVDMGEHEGKDKAIVKSRLLLNAAKALRGRGEVSIEVDRGGVFMRASTGGQVKLTSFTTQVPTLVRPPKKAEAQFSVGHPGLGLAAKVFPAVTSKHHPADMVYLTSGRGSLTFTGCDSRSYASWDVPVAYQGDPWSLGAAPAALFPALRDLTEAGVIAHGDGRLAIRSGMFLVGVKLGAFQCPFPTPESHDTVRVEANRKQLIEALKGMAGGDVNKRTRLEAGTNTQGDEYLAILNWEGHGSMDLDAQVTGKGRVGVDADRMGSLLKAMPGKSAIIEFEGTRPSPVRILSEEAEGWTTLIAPVA